MRRQARGRSVPELLDYKQSPLHHLHQFVTHSVVFPVLHKDHRNTTFEITETILPIGARAVDNIVLGKVPGLGAINDGGTQRGSQGNMGIWSAGLPLTYFGSTHTPRRMETTTRSQIGRRDSSEAMSMAELPAPTIMTRLPR